MKQEERINKLSSRDQEMVKFLGQMCDMQQLEKINGEEETFATEYLGTDLHRQLSQLTYSSQYKHRALEESIRDKISKEDLEMVKMYLLRACDPQRKRSMSPSKPKSANRHIYQAYADEDNVSTYTDYKKSSIQDGEVEHDNRDNASNNSSVEEIGQLRCANNSKTIDRVENDNRDGFGTSDTAGTYMSSFNTFHNSVEEIDQLHCLNRTKVTDKRDAENMTGVSTEHQNVCGAGEFNINEKDRILFDNNNGHIIAEDDDQDHFDSYPTKFSNNMYPDADEEQATCLSPLSLLSFGVLKEAINNARPSKLLGPCVYNPHSESKKNREDEYHGVGLSFVDNGDETWGDVPSPSNMKEESNVEGRTECDVQVKELSNKVRYSDDNASTVDTAAAVDDTVTNEFSAESVKLLKNRIQIAHDSGNADLLYEGSKECINLLMMQNDHDVNRSKHLALVSEEVSNQHISMFITTAGPFFLIS